MAHVITLTGPSQCGKSVVVDMLMKAESPDFRPILVPKYVTRDKRDTDGSDVICCREIPKDCDMVYEQYAYRYGFSFDTLYRHLKQNQCPIVIINDIKVLQDMRRALGSQVLSIYIYRKMPILQNFIDEETRRAGEGVDPERIRDIATSRYHKAVTIYRIYIENIALFDSVLLNVDTYDSTQIQVENIVGQIAKPKKYLK